MPSYENEKCPVCGKPFAEGDDIVTCPECGTPHHRECYLKTGECKNASLHESGFVFKRNQGDKEKNSSEQDENEDCYRVPRSEVEAAIKRIDQIDVFDDKYEYFFLNAISDKYEKTKETIDGESVADIANAVKTNTDRFVSKFIKNKKISWNWGAFFFGPYYLFFRKMYKEGSIFLALQLAISLIAQGIFSKPYAALTEFITSNADIIKSGSMSDSFISEFTALYQKILPMMAIIFAAKFVIHIVIAVFSDFFYRRKIVKLVKNVNSELAEGNTFKPIVPLQMHYGPSAPINDLKLIYFRKTGGTTILSPIIAFCILDLITSFISQL